MKSCWSLTRHTVITNPNETELSELEAALGYSFVDKSLLIRALTHKSVGSDNNQRLEYLGDAVLGYVVARRLFATRPDDGEDIMTLMRASVVKGETLAQVAADVGIAQHLRLGVGERRSVGTSGLQYLPTRWRPSSELFMKTAESNRRKSSLMNCWVADCRSWTSTPSRTQRHGCRSCSRGRAWRFPNTRSLVPKGWTTSKRSACVVEWTP